jgi:nucleotide-binding universal stress UspA family protein
LLGDDADRVFGAARCPVAIAPPGAASIGAVRRIGVGYDGSEESKQALTGAREIARRVGAPIEALAVVSLQDIPDGEPIPENWPDVARTLMGDRRRQLAGLGDIQGDVTYGDPGDELLAFSEQVDLLLVGSRSDGPLGRLLNGSSSHFLARRARCALVVIPRRAGATAGCVAADKLESHAVA